MVERLHPHAAARDGTEPKARSVALQENPDALLAARQALLASGAHLHGPDIAERLGVPEAAIFAARVGQDAIELVADLVTLLAPLAEWSKVLIATRSPFGAALCLGRFAPPTAADGRLCLENAEHRIEVATASVDRIYLLREADKMHGQSLSLNAFDAAGDALLRVYLLSKDGRDMAASHFTLFGLCPFTRRWRPRTDKPTAAQAARVLAAPDSAARAGHLLARAVLALPERPDGTLTIATPTAQLRTRAETRSSEHISPVVHATGHGLKLHLRPAAAATMQHIDRQGLRTLCFLAENGDRLEFGPSSAEAQPAFDQWLANLTQSDGGAAPDGSV
ncbi:MAG: ChuX/HutX family heme-like substrate-binding protein [Casimicrobiaceae bacterium]